MDTRIYHGKLTISEMANALVARFNRGNLSARRMIDGDKAIVQISSLKRPASGGQTAIGVTLQQNRDGITVQLGQQAWLGIAASLGASAFSALKNPISLLGRLDDIAQDFENLQLDEQIWSAIDDFAKAAGASHHLSENLRSLGCAYCGVANPIGASSCMACGAPLGDAQPVTCGNCGFLAHRKDKKCPNCGKGL